MRWLRVIVIYLALFKMIITYQGDNYFKLQSGDTNILVDPMDQRSFRGANIVLNTKTPAEVEEPDSDDKVFWIDHAGEYEIGGTRIRGWQVESNDVQKSIFRLDFEGFRIVIFGSLEKSLDENFQEHLTGVDIAIAPAGGEDVIKPSDMAKFIRQLEPALVVPALGKNSSDFLKEFNKDDCKKEEKIVLRKSDLTEGEIEVRCLKSS